MSGGSLQPEATPKDPRDELRMIQAVNEALREYLEHVRSLKADLTAMHKNFKDLGRVNQEWVDSLKEK